MNSVKLYYHRHSVYKNELKFLSRIYDLFNVELLDKKFDLNIMHIDKRINIGDLVSDLKSDLFLKNWKRTKLISELEKLPKEINIVKSLSDISVDFTFQILDQFFFYEFHEAQHKTLIDKKIVKVYSLEGNPISIPKYAQRFLRDIWRVQNLPNYKIVWHDWFITNYCNFKFNFDPDFEEFYFENSFSFKNLLRA